MIGAIAYYKGLDELVRLEKFALGMTLLIIAALLVGFGIYDANAVTTGIQWPQSPSNSWWEAATILGGTLIVVQGFETSRYLGKSFDREVRVLSCRLSQIVSTCVYLLFVALATPLMHFLGESIRDNDLIMLAAKASVLLPLPLVIAAVLSQFSAAVADTISGSGNAVEVTHGHVDMKFAALVICGGAVVLCLAPTFTILALASRAFAFYYFLQCLVAVSLTKSVLRRLFFLVLAFILAFITLFAMPAG
jgi:hypothetical protein